MKQPIPMIELPENVEISTVFTEEETPNLGDKHYLKEATITESKGAFHEKKDKNRKVNLGGSYKRKIKAKYSKPKNRSQKKK